MTPYELEASLVRQRRNPLRWIRGSKAIWIGLAILIVATTCLLLGNAIGVASGNARYVIPILLIAMIGVFYRQSWLGQDDFDFRFSDDWFRSASALPNLPETERRRLMTIAIMNSGTAALAWIKRIQHPKE